MKNLVVTAEDEGIRLDRFFKRHFAELSNNELQRRIREKYIKVNHKKATCSDRLVVGDVVTYPDNFGEEQRENTKAKIHLTKDEEEKVRSWVIYKDNDIIAINKPAGIAVQGGTRQITHIDNLLSALSFGLRRPKLVHRLDKDTSGALILARNDLSAAWLTGAFRERTIHKMYYAILDGKVEGNGGIINAPLRKKMIGNQELVVVDERYGDEAVTKYEVISKSEYATFVRFSPLTGRTHQLRVHSRHIGHPILGDKKYSTTKRKKLLLHSAEIDIPFNEKMIKITAPVPDYMREAARELGLEIGDEIK